LAVVVPRRRARVLLVRRPPRGLWGGLWEFPTIEIAAREGARAAAGRALRERIGLRTRPCTRLGRFDHLLTHRLMRFHVFGAPAGAGAIQLDGYDAHDWMTLAQVSRAPISTATRRICELATD
jgi:A/G-specific adenine glycosylase